MNGTDVDDSSGGGPATRAACSGQPASPAPTLRRATEALRAIAEVDHAWSDQDLSEVSAAVAEHLFAVAAVLPPGVPSWLIGWQRLARRHGLVATPAPADATDGIDPLTDLRARLEQIAYRAEQCATRHNRVG